MVRSFLLPLMLLCATTIVEGRDQWKAEAVTIYSLRGDTVREAYPGQKLLFQVDSSVYSGLWELYFDHVFVGTLCPYRNTKGWYRFELPATIGGERFEEAFDLFDEHAIPVTLSLGNDLNHRREVGTIEVVIDPKRSVRRVYSPVTAAALLLIFLFIMAKGGLNFLKDPGARGERSTFSLSRTQFAYWTLIILINYFYVWIYSGKAIDISVDLLDHLGISADTYLSLNSHERKMTETLVG